jgi:hypothetical protein
VRLRVGGLRTQLGGAIEITARSQGTFAGTTMTDGAAARRRSRLDWFLEGEVTSERR